VKDDLADSALFSILGLLISNCFSLDRSMQDESVASLASDPLRAVADAMDAAVQAAKEGGDRALATASDIVPAVGQFLSQAVYKTCYSVSFCAVFPMVLIARSIPRDNAAVHGFIDGARAAIDLVDQMKSRSASN
jgi:hypothetical protein